MNISVNRVRHLQGTRFFSLIKNCYLLPSVRYSSTNQPQIADSDMTLTKNEYKPKLQNAEQAVNNILSNVNLQSTLPVLTKHIINCMVVNEIGVISRVSGALSGMGININSLVIISIYYQKKIIGIIPFEKKKYFNLKIIVTFI